MGCDSNVSSVFTALPVSQGFGWRSTHFLSFQRWYYVNWHQIHTFTGWEGAQSSWTTLWRHFLENREREGKNNGVSPAHLAAGFYGTERNSPLKSFCSWTCSILSWFFCCCFASTTEGLGTVTLRVRRERRMKKYPSDFPALFALEEFPLEEPWATKLHMTKWPNTPISCPWYNKFCCFSQIYL